MSELAALLPNASVIPAQAETSCVLSSAFALILRSVGSPQPTRFAVALSGGADSLALTLLAHDWATAHGATIVALTVDHRLREGSTAEAAHVARMMQERGIAHHILTPPPMPAIRNPQAAARARRYDAMLGYCRSAGITHLLLGHHADDQAETVALQRHRGSNPASRAGMAFVTVRAGVTLVRPLLGVRKTALIAYLKQRGMAWVEDPSNVSDRYARNRVRHSMRDAEIISLWHEAQAQGEQRHANDVARNAWMSAHARVAEGCATIALDAWRALREHETRMDYLSHAIRVIGGKPYRPRLAESERLALRMLSQPAGRATLGHCLVDWQANTVLLSPEPAHARTLDARASQPHMGGGSAHNPLVGPPFWWFNLPLITDLE
jgi:tRNA(Ile)-lysidine synthase